MWWGGGLRVLKEIGGDPDRRGRARERGGGGARSGHSLPVSQTGAARSSGVSAAASAPQHREGRGARQEAPRGARCTIHTHTQTPSNAFQGSREPQKGSGGPPWLTPGLISPCRHPRRPSLVPALSFSPVTAALSLMPGAWEPQPPRLLELQQRLPRPSLTHPPSPSLQLQLRSVRGRLPCKASSPFQVAFSPQPRAAGCAGLHQGVEGGVWAGSRGAGGHVAGPYLTVSPQGAGWEGSD